MHKEEFYEMSKVENTHWWYLGRRSIIKTFLEKLKFKNKIKILEIGCGTGSNINLLNNYGSVSVLEPNELALSFLNKKNLKIDNIKIGNCPKDINLQEKFDLVCLFDVLEHIEEDKETIHKLSSILSSNGHLFITVPAYNWLWSDHDERLMHKRRYSIKNLKKLVPNDLNIKHLTYFNTFLLPLAILDRLLQKYTKLKNQSNFFLINFLFKKIFQFERYILKYLNFKFGLSILLILKKN